ncbi:MAG: acyl-CoA dehydrogenase family protein [Actinobacteria bacterium]|nr:acyl-CoA dehydrogenase family protein [Actinomycetota bacterium]
MVAAPTADEVRAELRAWLDENWDPRLTLREWWARLGESGWAAPAWPPQWFGKGLSGHLANAVRRELVAAGVAGAPAGLGIMLAGPTILAHGDDDQKQRFLRPIVTGEVAWCQLFSEPGAGSDLASLACRAARHADEWIVNGQKVWTSGGRSADLGMLLARTEPGVPKHKGISWFAIDMHQPGIEVRPLREMTGRALFSEVFLDDARVRAADCIGGLNQGWGVALTTLAHERVGLGGGGGATGAAPGKGGGMLERPAGEVAAGLRSGGRSGTAAAMAGGGATLLRKLAQDRGRSADPVIRQLLAGLHALDEISRYSQLRAKSSQAGAGGPAGSTGKLQISEITRASRDVGLQILGAAGTLHGRDAPDGGLVAEMALFSPATSIYGGTDEIQKNIIGERVLGLPREPDPSRDVPFSELDRGGDASDPRERR